MARKPKKTTVLYEVDFIYTAGGVGYCNESYMLSQEQVDYLEECMQSGNAIFQFDYIDGYEKETTVYLILTNVARVSILRVEEQ